MSSSFLISPLDGFRAGFRTWARWLVEYPGEGYNPLCVAPLHHAEDLLAELRAAGSEFGVRIAEGWPLEEEGVVVLPLSDWLERVRRNGGTCPRGVQVVCWGGIEEGEGVWDLILGSRGFRYDPGDRGPVGFPRGSARSVLARLREPELEGLHLVVESSDVHSLSVSQAQFWLEMGGHRPAVLVGIEADLLEVKEGDPVVLRLAGEGPQVSRLGAWARERVESGGCVVVLCDEEALGLLRGLEGWTEWGERGGEGVFPRTEVSEVAARQEWPAWEDLLLGAPEGPGEVEAMDLGVLGKLSLASLLQINEAWGRDGYFVLFDEEHFGWIRLSADRVLDAVRWGELPAEGNPQKVGARIREMSRWRGVRVLFVLGEVAGSLGREVPSESVGAIVLGLSRMDDAARFGTSLNLEVAPPVQLVTIDVVVEALLERGLRGAVVQLLQYAERRLAWAPERDFLLGHLKVATDVQEAIRRMEQAMLRLASTNALDPVMFEVQVSAMLNVLLLKVRERLMHPREAWSVAARWLEELGTGWITSARHASILFELAVRAGMVEDGRKLLSLAEGFVVVEGGGSGDLVRRMAPFCP